MQTISVKIVFNWFQGDRGYEGLPGEKGDQGPPVSNIQIYFLSLLHTLVNNYAKDFIYYVKSSNFCFNLVKYLF